MTEQAKPSKPKVAPALAAKRQAQKKKQQQQLLLFGGIAIAVLVIAGAVIYFTTQEATKVCAIDDTKCFDTYAGIPLSVEFGPARDDDGVKLASDVAEGVERGVTEDGIPYIGSPNAPVVFAEFADFSCPHCAEYAPEVDRLIKDFVRNGQARWEYYPVTFVGGAFSRKASDAAICAGQQGAFWEFHQQLFNVQQAESREAFNTERMLELADEMGLDQDELRTCMNSNYPRQVLAAVDELRATLDVTSTPTVVYRPGGPTASGWRFFTDSSGQQATRGSYDQVAAIVRQFNTPPDAGQ
jgi:protein-disulfide isomerase